MSDRTSVTAGTDRTDNTVTTFLTDDDTNVSSARRKESYKVRFSDGRPLVQQTMAKSTKSLISTTRIGDEPVYC
jgi:hypothetical protein